jgi:predicted alpha-1,2-mannosidase
MSRPARNSARTIVRNSARSSALGLARSFARGVLVLARPVALARQVALARPVVLTAGLAAGMALAAGPAFTGIANAAAQTSTAARQGAGAHTSTVARQSLVADPASLVNPFIGTEGGGNESPGAHAPFGMVTWGPDTPNGEDGGGYKYTDSSITGFSLTHLSGVGCRATGEIPVLPTVGALDNTATDSFSHADESADADSYSVALGNGVTTQLTATTRTGMAQFTFPSTSQANLIFKLSGDGATGSATPTATTFNVVSDTEVTGSVTSGGFCGASNSYTVYFDMQFSQPFSTSSTFSAAVTHAGARHLAVRATAPRGAKAPAPVSPAVPEQADHPVLHGTQAPAAPALTGPDGADLTFDTTSDQTLLTKVGLSYVSTANAAANLTAEDPGWDFATVQDATQDAWNALLGKVQIAGGTADQQQEFYTALYRALSYPNVFSDDNGQYPGVDGKVHTVDAGHSAFYTNFSGWDIYRAQAQLDALLDPQVAGDTAQSMVDDYAQDGSLPKWMENNGETHVMVGDPADEILADYYAFGGTDFDASTALSDMVSEATRATLDRPGLNYLTSPGYLPLDGTYCGTCNYYGPVSSTLEYDTADFAISALAGALNQASDRTAFLTRAQDWQNLLNPGSGFMQPRESNGAWASSFSPTSGTGFVEGDSWQYTGMVPFNVAGLSAAMGGSAALVKYLDSVLSGFTGSSTAATAAMGNEPSLELPWEYDYAGEPYQTQETVRKIQDQIWTDTPDGLAGNDDLGTMSAWFVWSALGLYPMTPGTADLALGSPMFSEADVTLPSGNTLTIDGSGAADDAPYVQSATWNGSAWSSAHAPTSAITSGGTLSFDLGTTANTAWASASPPPSYGEPTPARDPSGAGAIVSSVAADRCLDDSGSGTANRNKIDIYGCNSSNAQVWTIDTDGTIHSALGGCLDVTNSGTANGTLVDYYACNGTGAQDWRPSPDGALVNPESGKCLDDPSSSTTQGTQLDISTCNSGTNQDWVLPYTGPRPPTGAITSVGDTSLCADDNDSSTSNANKVDIWACNGSIAQVWSIEADGTIHSALGGCLDVTHSGTANGTLVDYYACNNTGAQQWQPGADGSLVNPESGKCLDDPGSSTTNGTQLDISTCTGDPNQGWNSP